MLQILAREKDQAEELLQLEAEDAADEAAYQAHMKALDEDHTGAEYEAVTAEIIAETQARLPP